MGQRLTIVAVQGKAQLHQIAEAGVEVSMSWRGDCWDNAVVESFFATLTKELLDGTPVPTRAAARREVAKFIEGW